MQYLLFRALGDRSLNVSGSTIPLWSDSLQSKFFVFDHGVVIANFMCARSILGLPRFVSVKAPDKDCYNRPS
jgi:hypothetical protein